MSKTTVFSIPFDDISLEEAAERAVAMSEERRSAIAVTPNAEILLAARRDARLQQILQRADLTVADGIGVILLRGCWGNRLHTVSRGSIWPLPLWRSLPEKGRACICWGRKMVLVNRPQSVCKSNIRGFGSPAFTTGIST